jgi:hypothetical protein
MQKIISSDEFVAGLMAALALSGRTHFRLDSNEIDEKFEKAYKVLVDRIDDLDVLPAFSFERDGSHGDSATLRDTLMAARERKIIALNNPTLWTLEIKLPDERAIRYLKKNPLPQQFYEDLVAIFD